MIHVFTRTNYFYEYDTMWSLNPQDLHSCIITVYNLYIWTNANPEGFSVTSLTAKFLCTNVGIKTVCRPPEIGLDRSLFKRSLIYNHDPYREEIAIYIIYKIRFCTVEKSFWSVTNTTSGSNARSATARQPRSRRLAPECREISQWGAWFYQADRTSEVCMFLIKWTEHVSATYNILVVVHTYCTLECLNQTFLRMDFNFVLQNHQRQVGISIWIFYFIKLENKEMGTKNPKPHDLKQHIVRIYIRCPRHIFEWLQNGNQVIKHNSTKSYTSIGGH
jgi:hypothetical protein